MQISKCLSRLLRHQAKNAGIKLDREGFAPLDQVLQWGPLKNLNVSLDEVKAVVQDNSKQRFTLKLNPTLDVASRRDSPTTKDYLIRANQGHTLQIDAASLFTPIAIGDANFPTKCVHGTYFAFWNAIVSSGGLRPMGRGHIHCSDRTPEEGALSGMRMDAELIVEIDMGKSMAEGMSWFRSSNGVILTDGGRDGLLSTRYFRRVIGRKAGVGVLWQDGAKTADLPPGLRMAAPRGKRVGVGVGVVVGVGGQGGNEEGGRGGQGEGERQS